MEGSAAGGGGGGQVNAVEILQARQGKVRQGKVRQGEASQGGTQVNTLADDTTVGILVEVE